MSGMTHTHTNAHSPGAVLRFDCRDQDSVRFGLWEERHTSHLGHVASLLERSSDEICPLRPPRDRDVTSDPQV